MDVSEIFGALLNDTLAMNGADPTLIFAGLAIVMLLSVLAGCAIGKLLLWLPEGIKGLLLLLWEILDTVLHRLFGRVGREGGTKQEDGNENKRRELEKRAEKLRVELAMRKLDARWRARKQEELREREEMRLEKNLYLERALSEKQRDKLDERGYKRLKISAFGDSGASYYLVKPRWNESALHAFFCFLIEAELGKMGKKADLLINNGPDIVFEHKKRKYCIDVETGTNLARSREKVERKFGFYAREYYRSYIFVTKKKLKHRYRRYGLVVTRATLKKVLKTVFD